MAQIVSAVVTDLWREKLAKLYSGDTSLGDLDSTVLPDEFHIGEGGFTDPGTGKEPKVPDPSKTALEAPSNPPGEAHVFEKAFIPADLTFSSPTRLEIRCLIGSSEGNGPDALGNPPEYFELGIFDGASPPRLLVYSTFPIEIKTSSKALEHLIFVDF